MRYCVIRLKHIPSIFALTNREERHFVLLARIYVKAKYALNFFESESWIIEHVTSSTTSEYQNYLDEQFGMYNIRNSPFFFFFFVNAQVFYSWTPRDYRSRLQICSFFFPHWSFLHSNHSFISIACTRWDFGILFLSGGGLWPHCCRLSRGLSSWRYKVQSCTHHTSLPPSPFPAWPPFNHSASQTALIPLWLLGRWSAVQVQM